MKIGYDITLLSRENWTGVEKLSFNLFNRYWKYDRSNTHILFCFEYPKYLKTLHDNIEIVIIKKIPFWRFLILPRLLKRNSCDLFISPTHFIPIVFDIPIFSYIHECQWLYQSKEKNHFYSKINFHLACLFSSVLLTNSENTARDIEKSRMFKREKKIEVISPSSCLPVSIETFEELNTLTNYFLSISTVRPKKNIQFLLDTFRRNPEYNLIHVGKIREPSLIENAPKNVHFLGYLPDDKVSYLLQKAIGFIYISRSEGFGIPILEAFTHKCPLIASVHGSIPEVAGDAALYINDTDYIDLVKSLSLLQNDFKLRQELIEKGQERLKIYSWEKSVEKLRGIVDIKSD